MKKTVTILVILLICSSILYSEGTKEDVDTVTLEYWIHSYDLGVEANTKLVEEFESQNPNIKVKLSPVGNSSALFEKLLVAYSGGTGPDVFWFPSWWVPRFASLDMLAEVPDEQHVLDMYQPGAMEGYYWNDKLYSTGISEIQTISLLYNKDIFDEAGIPYPSETEPMTIDEIIEIGQKLTKHDEQGRRQISGFEFERQPTEPANKIPIVFNPIVRQLGGDFADSKGNPKFTDPAVIQTFQLMQDFEQKYDITNTSFIVDFGEDVANGRIAMFLGASYHVKTVENINPDARIGVAPFPVVSKDVERNTVQYSWGWLVNKNTSHFEEAWKFAEFMATEDPDLWWEICSFMQPLAGRYDELRELDEFDEYLFAFVDDLAYSHPIFQSPDFNDIVESLGQVQTKIMSDENADVKKTLEEAQSNY